MMNLKVPEKKDVIHEGDLEEEYQT